jgi:hypothetical protein
MAAQTGQGRSSADQLQALDGVISISSSESDVDDGNKSDGDERLDGPEVSKSFLDSDSDSDNSLPSVSALIATARRNHTEDTGKQ